MADPNPRGQGSFLSERWRPLLPVPEVVDRRIAQPRRVALAGRGCIYDPVSNQPSHTVQLFAESQDFPSLIERDAHGVRGLGIERRSRRKRAKIRHGTPPNPGTIMSPTGENFDP